MKPSDHESSLPKVTQADIAVSFGDDVTSADPLERWMNLFDSNIHLAIEIRDRAHTEAVLSRNGNEISDQLADRFIHMATYVLDIVKNATERERAEEIQRITKLNFSDGGDDADQPL